jgi:hypothetical protein
VIRDSRPTALFTHGGNCILARVPVRTSVVVAGGLALLTIIGVTAIFGDTLLAMVAPPRTESFSSSAATTVRPAAGGGQNAATIHGPP